MNETPPFEIGFLLFPNVTQLDLTAPWEILSNLPNSLSRLIWKQKGPVTALKGMTIMADSDFATCPQLDLLCIPGGPGMNDLLTDDETLAFIAKQAAGARYVTSVCTGSLVLGAAGLLKGKRAASHWTSRDMLASFGATPVNERVVIDGNVITGGGVTAGIDFALMIVNELKGETLAQLMQLGVEYAPAPPFNSGSPETAPAAIVEGVMKGVGPMLAVRRAQVEKAAAKLKG